MPDVIVMQIIQVPAHALFAANIALPEPALLESAFSRRMVNFITPGDSPASERDAPLGK